jgi:hypothetical protein
MVRKAANQRKIKKSSNSKLPLTLSMQALPLGRIYHVSSLNHSVRKKSSTNFVHIFSRFGNELIKHKPREARDAMHEIKITMLQKVYKQVFKQLYSTNVDEGITTSDKTIPSIELQGPITRS